MKKNSDVKIANTETEMSVTSAGEKLTKNSMKGRKTKWQGK